MTKNDEVRKTLGEKLKSARKNAKFTQEQLAEKLLVSRQAITKWEADKGMPDIENLKRFSKLFHISMEFLNSVKNADKEFYLVNQLDRQFFVIVTDEFMESRQLAEKISDKKFEIGNFSFVDCGIISEL